MKTHQDVLHFALGPTGSVPNNPRLPLVVYRGSFPQTSPAELARTAEETIAQHGWEPAWRWGVYDFPHFHSTAHELLVVYRGTATLRLGHDAGVTIDVEPGDALVIPAGVAHQNLGSSGDFHVVGAYPQGQKADLIRADQSDRAKAESRIAQVPLPKSDPMLGDAGPLATLWLLPRRD